MKRRTYKPTKLVATITERRTDHWLAKVEVWERSKWDGGMESRLVTKTIVLHSGNVDPADFARLAVKQTVVLPAKRGPRRWHVRWTPSDRPRRRGKTSARMTRFRIQRIPDPA